MDKNGNLVTATYSPEFQSNQQVLGDRQSLVSSPKGKITLKGKSQVGQNNTPSLTDTNVVKEIAKVGVSWRLIWRVMLPSLQAKPGRQNFRIEYTGQGTVVNNTMKM